MMGAVQKDIKNQKEEQFKVIQKLFILRENQANLIGDISGCLSASRNLQANINTLKQQAQRQQELLYNAEFQIQTMERHVSIAQGDRSMEDIKRLEKEIDVLNQEQKDLQKDFITLNQSNKQLIDEL